jgi:hypothetical protein
MPSSLIVIVDKLGTNLMKIMACFRMLQINSFVLDGPEESLYVCIIGGSSLSIH